MSATTPSPPAPGPSLKVHGLTRTFGPTVALDGVELAFAAGRITAIVGANGSGKSTLLSILSGALLPTAGDVLAFGAPVRSIAQAHRQGVVLVPQEPALAEHLTVWQNVSLTSPDRHTRYLLRDARARQLAATHLQGLVPADQYELPVRELSKSRRQLVQLAAAMARNPRVLLLDEPTAVLDEDGVAALHGLVREFHARGGTVLIVSHRLRDVLQLAQDVVVLRNGRVQLATAVDAGSEEQVVRLLSAEDRSHRPTHRPDPSTVVLRARDVRGWRGLEVDELVVHAGEVVGIAGQSGAGRSRLAAVLAGTRPAGGELTVGGRGYRTGDVRAARRAGVRYIPEDRHRSAIMGNRTVQDNLLIGHGDPALHAGPFRRRSAEDRVARGLIEAYDVRPPLPDKPAGLLSGGNQQKLAVARALAGHPAVVIADEPTQGVDATTRAAIHDALAGAAADGTAIVAVCSDFEELFDIVDRIVVLCAGRVVLDRPRADTTHDEVLAASLGSAEAVPLPVADLERTEL